MHQLSDLIEITKLLGTVAFYCWSLWMGFDSVFRDEGVEDE